MNETTKRHNQAAIARARICSPLTSNNTGMFTINDSLKRATVTSCLPSPHQAHALTLVVQKAKHSHCSSISSVMVKSLFRVLGDVLKHEKKSQIAFGLERKSV